MKYTFTKNESDVVTCTFSDNITIDPQIYNIINHNITFMLPCMRELSNMSAINYDALGVTTLDDELGKREFDKSSLYELIFKISDTIEKIMALGINENQLIFDMSNVYVSTYDSSVRYICLPIDTSSIELKYKISNLLKNIVLNVKSNGAYELIGFVIEKTSIDSFSVSRFKQELHQLFSKDKFVNTPLTSDLPKPSYNGVQGVSYSAELHKSSNTIKPEVTYTGREYVPEGMPIDGNSVQQHNASNDSDKKTQLLFASMQDVGNIPYLSPVDNNTEEARVYLVGEKLTIGRSPGNDLCLNVATISGKHAEIHISRNGCTITDLNSTNKTYVNGKVLTPNMPVSLNHQDLIAFNKIRFRYFDY